MGVDHYALACDPVALSRYVEDCLDWARTELLGVESEVPSRDLPVEAQRKAWEEGRTEVVLRAADHLRWIASVLTAVGCTDEELETAYAQVIHPEPEPDGASEKSDEQVDDTVD